MAHETHPPLTIYLMLVTMTLISALLIGYGMAGARQRNWLHSLGYAAVMVCVLYVILDFSTHALGSSGSTISTRSCWTCARA